MEQTTTGKAPPPIAINSGGGIQILNMRGAAGIGATVVPSPGSAQTATVVGSPGPPGKAVGPRMISISPQMLANASRPGQPVEESDTESVNQCDDDNHELLKTTNAERRRSPSPASITGVSSSGLQRQHAFGGNNVTKNVDDDKCEKLQEDDSIVEGDKLLVAKVSDNHIEGSDDRTTVDVDNDLSLSNPAVDKSIITTVGSPNQIVNERSVSHNSSPVSPCSSSSPNNPPLLHSDKLDNEPLGNCDENNKNHPGGNTVVEFSCSLKNHSPEATATTRDLDSLDLPQQELDRKSGSSSCCNNENVIISSCKELVSEGAHRGEESIINDGANLESSKVSNDKCIYDKVKKSVVPVQPNPLSASSLASALVDDLSVLQRNNNNNNVDNSSSQSCVQTNCEKSIVPEVENLCDKIDEQDQAAVIVAASDPEHGNNSSSAEVVNKCLNTTETLEHCSLVPVNEKSTTGMGSNQSKEPQSVVIEEVVYVDETMVDEVNLDMFSDSGVADSDDAIPLANSNCAIIQQVERRKSSDDNAGLSSSTSSVVLREEGTEKLEATTNSFQQEDERINERKEESRPKLMDMNLVDFIYMDCEEDVEVLGERSSSIQTTITTATTPSSIKENHQTWNQATRPSLPSSAATAQSTTAEHPYTPPKVVNEIFTPPTPPSSRISSGEPLNTFTQSNNSSSFWSKSKAVTLENQHHQQQQSPPSCAFQLYGHHGQHGQENLPVAVRIPMRHDIPNHPQQHSYTGSSSVRLPLPTAYSNFNNSVMRDGAIGLPPTQNSNNPISYPSVRANVSSSSSTNSSEYKTNFSHSQQQHQQQQRCFTNDPQLHSQFIQYTKNFPLGQQDNNNGKQELVKISTSVPSSSAAAAIITRGQYVHAPTQHRQQDHMQSNKTHPIKPVVVSFPQQSHQHQMNSVRQATGVVQHPQVQQRHYSPTVSQQQQHYQQQQQNSPFQSQYRSNIVNANGCDTSKPSYQMQQVNSAVAAATSVHNRSNYNIGHGPPTSVVTSSPSIRPVVAPGGTAVTYFSQTSPHQNTSSSLLAQSQQQTIQVHQHQSAMQKESSSCAYSNAPGGSGGVRLPSQQTGVYNPSHIPQANFPGVSASSGPATVPQHNSYPSGNFGGYNKTLSGPPVRMPFSQQQQQYPPPVRPVPNMPSSSQIPVINCNNSKTINTGRMATPGSGGWNPPLLQGARAQLLQVLRPNAFPSHQNLAGQSGEITHQPPTQQSMYPLANRLHPSIPPQLPHSQQQHFRPTQVQQGTVQMPQHQIPTQHSASVIAQRYVGVGSANHQDMPGGSNDNSQHKHSETPSSSSSLPSPQMLRNSQYIAHSFRSVTASTEHRYSSPGAYNNNQSSVIRPNVYTTTTTSGNTAAVTSVAANTSDSNSSINNNNNSRAFYGTSNTGNSNSNNTYYNNQASVIRAPPSSSGSSNNNSAGSSNSSTCTINRNTSNSCIVIERGSPHSNAGYQRHLTSSTTGGYNSGELTLQSFLSHPTAPFMCPSSSPSTTPPSTSSVTSPLSAERSTSVVGSGYHYNVSSENRGGASYHARGDNQDGTYPSLSSCQYSDGAMRRYNAPITLQSLQALSGLPPGANHLLVKTENGQFQLVSVRMQSPTAAAAAPGTPVVPSTVAAPPTPMSIAQQLPSNSPHVAPPLPPPPHSGPPPGGPPSSLVPPPPPISSSMITTTTIPPHPSAQQGRIITSSSSNHIVTSWSSSNNNSLVNNNSTISSPLPVISSSAAHPPPSHPPHLAPPPPSAPPHHHAPPLPMPPPPPSVPSSVIMPPLSSASNSQLLISTANNNISSSSTSSSTYSTAAQAAISAMIENYNQQRAASSAQQQHGSSVMGPPGGSRQLPPPPPPSHSNSISTVVAPAAGPMSNSLPPGASVIRSGGVLGGAGSLPPPPPPVVVSTSSSAAAAAAVAAVANSVISSSTNPSNSNLPSAAAPTSPATFRPQQQQQQSNTSSPVPNNNATNNASGSMGMGMMTASSNSILSVQHPNHHHHHHQTPPPYNSQLHPHPQLPQQAPPSAYHTTSYTSNSIASSNSNTTTANTVSQMSNETAKTKCKNFLSFLLELSAKQNQTVARNVKNLIQGLIDGKVNEENFADRLQKEVNSQPQPCLVGFLKKSLPHLRHSLAVSELKIEGIKPPPLATFVPPAPVSALVPQTPPTPPEPTRKKPSKQTPTVRPTTPTVPASPVRIITPPVNSASPSSMPPTPTMSASSSGASAPPTASPSPSSTKSSKPSKGSSSKSKSNSSSNSSSAAGASASSGPGGTPSSKSSIPSTSKSSKEKEKKDKPFSSSGYSADDDINDVAAMGGVNLAEESQRILGSTEYVGTQIRSCRDETLIQASPITAKFKVIASKYGIEETPGADVSALLSHAVEERLKTMIEKLSVIAEHRMDVIKLDERYEITQDVKGQLRFLEELDKLEKKRHDEQEREMLIRAAKSRSKSEDPEQAKLKAKAKEMQRVALEEMRQRDANLTALQAIGPRKKPKLDTAGGSHGSAVPSPMGATGASSSLGRPQMPLRPRLKRVNLRDLLFLLEHDKETMRSPFLYKNLLLK